MGGSFDERELKWRPKGKRIANMSGEDIKKILNEKFRFIQQELRYEYGNRGYTGTLAEKDGANISYFPFLTDKELKTLKNWIQEFDREIFDWRKSTSHRLKSYGVSKVIEKFDNLKDADVAYEFKPNRKKSRYDDGMNWIARNAINDSGGIALDKWVQKLTPAKKKLLQKLIENGWLSKSGWSVSIWNNNLFYNSLICDDKWTPAVGIANHNVVYFFGMCSS